MEVAIAMAGPIMRGEEVELPGEVLRRKTALTSSRFHAPADMIHTGYVFGVAGF